MSKQLVREAPLRKAGQDGVTKLKGQSVNGGDHTDCDDDDDKTTTIATRTTTTTTTLSAKLISHRPKQDAVLYLAWKSIKNTLNGSFKVQEQQARATGLKRRDRLSSRR